MGQACVKWRIEKEVGAECVVKGRCQSLRPPNVGRGRLRASKEGAELLAEEKGKNTMKQGVVLRA